MLERLESVGLLFHLLLERLVSVGLFWIRTLLLLKLLLERLVSVGLFWIRTFLLGILQLLLKRLVSVGLLDPDIYAVELVVGAHFNLRIVLDPDILAGDPNGCFPFFVVSFFFSLGCLDFCMS